MLKLDKLIVIFCACYLAMLPLGLPHLMFVLGILYIFLKACSDRVSVNILWIFIFIIFGVFQVYIGGDWKAMVNNVSSMIMFPLAYEVLRNRDKDRLLSLGVNFIKVTIWFMSIEAVVRYVLATIMPMGEGMYNYKFHSFMFLDTNFAGLVLLVVVFFIKYLIRFHDIKSIKIYYFIAVVLLFLTVSRAAILAYIFGELIFMNISPTKYLKQIRIRLILLAIIGSIVGTTLFLWLSEDPSFKSKLYIFEVAESVYDDLGMIKYIGAGYNNSEEVLGIYAHNAIFLYLIDAGILGLLLKTVFLLYIMIKSKWHALSIFLPFFIAAQSAVGYGVHYLYVIMALVVVLSKYIRAPSG